MPRTLWKGAISFGLVHIPVGLYSAEKRNSFDLTMLDRRSMKPVGFKRYNKETGVDVTWNDIRVAEAHWCGSGGCTITERLVDCATPPGSAGCGFRRPRWVCSIARIVVTSRSP